MNFECKFIYICLHCLSQITNQSVSNFLAIVDEKEDERETKSRNNLRQRIRLRALLLVNIRPTAGIEVYMYIC